MYLNYSTCVMLNIALYSTYALLNDVHKTIMEHRPREHVAPGWFIFHNR